MNSASAMDMLSGLRLEDLERDPYPLYGTLRRDAPVAYIPVLGAWMATGFAEVKKINADSGTFAARLEPPVKACLGEGSIIDLDGERHQRYRRGLYSSLGPTSVEALSEVSIGAVVQRRLDALTGSRAELMADYFEPISVLSLGAIIGIPEVDADTLRHWFRGIVLGTSNNTDDPDVAKESNAISREIDEYMRDVFARLDAEPNGTVVSHLLSHAHGDTLEERIADISPTLKVVIGGGLQEPGHGASTLVAGLLSDAEQLERFLYDPPRLIAAAIEEALRWVAPIQIISKKTTRAVSLAGQEIPDDTYVLASLASANRERSIFGENADSFDIGRPRIRHLGFGFGAHFCSGSYFGRKLMKRAVLDLFTRFPDVQPDPSRPVEFGGFAFRAPKAVHVVLR